VWHGDEFPTSADSQLAVPDRATRGGRPHPAAAATLAIMRESVDAGTAERLNALTGGHFPGLIGFTVVEAHDDGLTARMPVRPDLLAPNGYLHAATVVGLADTACGFGCRLVLPEGATGFTTIELKANFLGTVRDGAVVCRARLAHGGRTTQVWDATVTAEETGRTLALFRCTQAILWPR
jgi:uncharacterized protein (TIGR00369 family)